MSYYLSFRNEVGDYEDLDRFFEDLRKATFEARDLQRILSKEKKDMGCSYVVVQEEPHGLNDQIIFRADGY